MATTDPLAPTRKSLSIKVKLALALSTFTLLGLSLTTWFILGRAREALQTEVTQRGILIGNSLASYSASALLVKDTLAAASLMRDAMKNEGMVYALLANGAGTVVADGSSELEHLGKPVSLPAGQALEVPGLPTGAEVTLSQDPATREALQAFSFPVEKNQVRIGTVYVGLSQARVQEVVGSLTREVAALSGLFLTIGFLGALVLSLIIVRPIQRLTRGATAIGRGDLDTRLKVGTMDEIGVLAKSFNDMAAGLKLAQGEAVKKELLQRDLSMAQNIQARLLPKSLPRIPGYDLVAYYQSAAQIGGDYYDVFDQVGGRFGLVVADVSGKGVPGSLGMAMTRSEFRAQARQGLSPDQALIRTNTAIFPDFKGQLFVSLFYAVLDPTAHRLTCACAGHNPAFKVTSSAVQAVKPRGAALGMLDPAIFKMDLQEVTLAPGDLFALYTDGITEAMDPQGEEYGEERLIAMLTEGRHLSLEELKRRVLGDVAAFVKTAPQHDDMSLLFVRRHGRGAP